MSRRAIGLLGGSFNPAHSAHVDISLLALKRLGLDQVWWLVSPQNPLKPSQGMATLSARIDAARAVAGDRRIHVSDLESRLNLRYTVDTVLALRRRFPAVDFVWLMGADNLVQIPSWRRWDELMRALPFAVVDRPGHTYRALGGRAAKRFARYRCRPDRALARRKPPAWCFLFARRNPLSASAIRAQTRN